jgi:histidinol-phosphatase (PHP family)
MILWDTHMHSQFSGDSNAPQEDMVVSAIGKNLSGMCFTDHLDIDHPDDPELFLLDLPNYSSSVDALRTKYHDTFPILMGIELGLQPHLAAIHDEIISQYPFDFVIGSSHVVHGVDPYHPPYYEGRSDRESFDEYFTSILENISAFNNFDVYGHLDYVVRYAPDRDANYSYRNHCDIIDEILKHLIEHGHGIEINTAGFRCGLDHPNPTEDIIRRYRELGGEIITVGADAHEPAHVGYAFDKVCGILKASGFKYFTVFEKRKPRFIQLEG